MQFWFHASQWEACHSLEWCQELTPFLRLTVVLPYTMQYSWCELKDPTINFTLLQKATFSFSLSLCFLWLDFFVAFLNILESHTYRKCFCLKHITNISLYVCMCVCACMYTHVCVQTLLSNIKTILWVIKEFCFLYSPWSLFSPDNYSKLYWPPETCTYITYCLLKPFEKQLPT